MMSRYNVSRTIARMRHRADLCGSLAAEHRAPAIEAFLDLPRRRADLQAHDRSEVGTRHRPAGPRQRVHEVDQCQLQEEQQPREPLAVCRRVS